MSNLTPFQIEKLEYYFKFFDSDNDGYLQTQDLSGFVKKILDYTGWEDNSPRALECYDIHSTFFDILREKINTSENAEDPLKVSNSDWILLWNSILSKCTGMHNFPVWLRLLPKSLFHIVDRKNDDVIDREELEEFYIKIVKLTTDEAESVSKSAYSELTDNGKYPLHMRGYSEIFANFLLGRTPYGPGRYIFGCFESTVKQTHFSLLQPAVVEPESESEQSEEDDMPTASEDGRPLFY